MKISKFVKTIAGVFALTLFTLTSCEDKVLPENEVKQVGIADLVTSNVDASATTLQKSITCDVKGTVNKKDYKTSFKLNFNDQGDFLASYGSSNPAVMAMDRSTFTIICTVGIAAPQSPQNMRLEKLVQSSYTRSLVLKFDTGEILQINGSANLKTNQFSQTFNGTVPAIFEGNPTVTSPESSFILNSISHTQVQYKGKYYLLVNGKKIGVEAVCTYTFPKTDLKLPKDQLLVFSELKKVNDKEFSGNVKLMFGIPNVLYTYSTSLSSSSNSVYMIRACSQPKDAQPMEMKKNGHEADLVLIYDKQTGASLVSPNTDFAKKLVPEINAWPITNLTKITTTNLTYDQYVQIVNTGNRSEFLKLFNAYSKGSVEVLGIKKGMVLAFLTESNEVGVVYVQNVKNVSNGVEISLNAAHFGY